MGVQGAGLRVIGFHDAVKRLQQLQDQKAVGNPMKDEGVNLTLTVSHGFGDFAVPFQSKFRAFITFHISSYFFERCLALEWVLQ